MLLGIWKNIEELEESINLPTLNLILERAFHQRREDQKFYAAFKGVDLDEGEKESAQERMDKIKQRVEAKLRGVSEEDIGRVADSETFGLDFEVEE